MFNAFFAMDKMKAELTRSADEQRDNSRRAWEQARINQERNTYALRQMEQRAPKTITINPGPNQSAPAFPIVFK